MRLELEKRADPGRIIRNGLLVIGAGVVAFCGWVVLAPLSGAIIAPGYVKVDLKEKRRIVEARIRPEDINYVHAGSEADIRLAAYRSRSRPLVPGKVTYVSGDRLVDHQTGAPYYIVHVDVPEKALSTSNLRLQAGMPAEVFFRTDHRTALDYLLAPVTSYLRRALREPV